MGRLPTSTDVARTAGVSRSTVSYVLNDTPGARVTEATRDRVRAAAAELGYVPNLAAADLRRGASRLILMVIERQRAASVISEFTGDLSDALGVLGFTVLTLQVSGDVDVEEAQTWAGLRPVAVFAVGTHLSTDARKLLRRSKVTLIGEYEADVKWSFDQGAIAKAGAEVLLSRGRTALLQILPEERSLAEFTEARVEAFADAAGVHGLGSVRLPLRPAAVADFVRNLESSMPTCDGMVVHNDDYAALVVGALLDAGVDVPGRIAVIGNDNAPWGSWMRPAISTLTIESEVLISTLTDALQAIVAGQPVQELRLEGTIRAIHRQTT